MRHTSLMLVAFSALGLAACAETGTDPIASGGQPSAYGSYDGGGWDGDRDGDGDRNAPERAVSYINPDIGAATANPDVDPTSSCFNPDQYDTQKLSPAGTATNNVHNDACFFGRSSSWSGWYGSSGDQTKIDGPASFESSGVGFINACPDPDNAGPKVAILSADRKRCFQSGYQEKGTAGDKEFHARLNNTSTPGTQRVVWCYDPERNGCSDSRVKSSVTVNWVQ